MLLSIIAAVFLNIVMVVTGLKIQNESPLDSKSPLDLKLPNVSTSRQKRGKIRPLCSEAKDHPFANCKRLKLAGKCPHSYLMRLWCPKTCKFCIEGRAAAHVPCEITKFGCCADGIKTAKGANGLGCPENCQDDIKHREVCKSYAKNGYCSIYYKTLQQICPRSCGMCGRKVVDGCYNKLEDSKCKELSLYGYCKSPSLKKRMAELCGLTCEACTKKAPKLSEVTPACAKVGCCWDKQTPLTQGCPPCKDSFPTTICPRFKMYCPDTDRMQSVQVRIFCPESCGICKASVTCADDITYGVFCKEWKADGECKKNRLAMGLFCKKTCGFC